MKVGGFYFGSRERSWKKYIDKVIRGMENADHKTLFVLYVGLSQRELNVVKEMIGDRVEFDQCIFPEGFACDRG